MEAKLPSRGDPRRIFSSSSAKLMPASPEPLLPQSMWNEGAITQKVLPDALEPCPIHHCGQSPALVPLNVKLSLFRSRNPGGISPSPSVRAWAFIAPCSVRYLSVARTLRSPSTTRRLADRNTYLLCLAVGRDCSWLRFDLTPESLRYAAIGISVRYPFSERTRPRGNLKLFFVSVGGLSRLMMM